MVYLFKAVFVRKVQVVFVENLAIAGVVMHIWVFAFAHPIIVNTAVAHEDPGIGLCSWIVIRP